MKMDGTPIPVQVEAARITWNGKPAILGLFSDITERKRGQDRVRRNESGLSSGHAGHFSFDLDGRYLEVNQPYAAMLGYRTVRVARTNMGADRPSRRPVHRPTCV